MMSVRIVKVACSTSTLNDMAVSVVGDACAGLGLITHVTSPPFYDRSCIVVQNSKGRLLAIIVKKVFSSRSPSIVETIQNILNLAYCSLALLSSIRPVSTRQVEGIEAQEGL